MKFYEIFTKDKAWNSKSHFWVIVILILIQGFVYCYKVKFGPASRCILPQY